MVIPTGHFLDGKPRQASNVCGLAAFLSVSVTELAIVTIPPRVYLACVPLSQCMYVHQVSRDDVPTSVTINTWSLPTLPDLIFMCCEISTAGSFTVLEEGKLRILKKGGQVADRQQAVKLTHLSGSRRSVPEESRANRSLQMSVMASCSSLSSVPTRVARGSCPSRLESAGNPGL